MIKDMATFEQSLQQSLFSGQSEKTFIDKLLAKEDSERIKELIKKQKLTREELLELLYLLTGTESKLVNYGEWDRYVILKYFVWIREFVKVIENLYDYHDDLKKKSSTCEVCEKLYKDHGKEKAECKCIEPKPKVSLTPRTLKHIYNIQRNVEHAAKFLIDLYFNIARTSLSLGATGFMEMLKNKFEISYPYGQGVQTPIQQQKTGIFGFRKNG